MRTTGCSWALKGLCLGTLGLFLPEGAWAEETCTLVEVGTSLADALGAGVEVSEDKLTITLLTGTDLCFEEGWTDPDPPACLSVTPGADFKIKVEDSNEDSIYTSIELPGLYLPVIPTSFTRSTVSLSNVDLVDACESTVSTGLKARLLVEGDHEVTLHDVTLLGDNLYGLYAEDGYFTVTFTDPMTVFAHGFIYKPAVKLALAAAEYRQTGGVLSGNVDDSALKSYGAYVELKDVHFDGNGGWGTSGGAIFVQNGELKITGGSFTNNTAASGGAIWGTTSATLTLSGVAFSDNSAKVDGGAVSVISIDTLKVNDGTSFTGDDAPTGGAIAFQNSQNLTVENASFTDTTATGSGGGIYASSGSQIVTLSNASFTGTVAKESGGGIYASGGLQNLYVYDVRFTSTSAALSGGAIYTTGGNAVLGESGRAPSFVSTSAPAGGAIALLNGKVTTKVTGATFEDIQGGHAIDISGVSTSATLDGLTSPNGLGQHGLLRVHSDAGAILSLSTITGVNSEGEPTTLATDTGLIEVKQGRLDLVENVLCGFIADPNKPLVNIDVLNSSMDIRENTFMNLDGVSAGQGFIRLNTIQTVYVFNNTFVGALGGAQSAVFAENVGGFIVFNNLFDQLGSGLLVGASTDLKVLNNLYSPTVDATVIEPTSSYVADEASLVETDPLFVRAFDPTRCSVWPFLTEGSLAIGAGTKYPDASGVGDDAQLGAWGALAPSDKENNVDTDGDGHSVIDDCDDADKEISPSAPEVAGNGVDDDCDDLVDEVTEDSGDDDSGGDDSGGDSGDDTALEVRPDADGDGVPDEDDCAPNDDQLTADCPDRFEYRGGRLGCATASPADLSALGLLLVAVAGTRRRRPPGLV